MAELRLTLTDDQSAYQAVLRSFLTDVLPDAETRRLMDTEAGFDEATWKRLCAEVGVSGLAIDERHGGHGGGVADLAAAFEELGRALAGLPALSTIGLAATALSRAGDEGAAGRWLPQIVAGSLTATLAWPEGNDELRALPSGGGYLVDGELAFVLDGHTADLVLVVSDTSQGPTLLAVEPATSDAVTATVLPTLDLTRKFARITLRGAVATAVGTPGSARTLLADTLDVARIYLAAEQLGGATRCLDQAVDYAKSRVQFGRQIGSFQAVKHRCANMLCAVEDARSAVRYASWVADHRPADLGRAAALAKAVSSDAFMFAAASNIQVHGGIGFTWEHTVHLPFKRAKAMQVFLGDSHAQRRRLADYLGL